MATPDDDDEDTRDEDTRGCWTYTTVEGLGLRWYLCPSCAIFGRLYGYLDARDAQNTLQDNYTACEACPGGRHRFLFYTMLARARPGVPELHEMLTEIAREESAKWARTNSDADGS